MVIANTKDQRMCQEFEKLLHHDMAIHGVQSQDHPSTNPPLDNDHPYSVTPIFSIGNDGNFLSEGDLSTVSSKAREAILHLHFVACPFFALLQTRLSHGSYQEVGAVITEVSNKDLCQDLHFGHMRHLIQLTKEAKKSEQQTAQPTK